MVDTTEGGILTPYGVFRNVFLWVLWGPQCPSVQVQRGNPLREVALYSVWAARQLSYRGVYASADRKNSIDPALARTAN